MSGYIGTQPVPQATQTRDSFTATSGQTSFATGGYTPNYLDVYLNGVKLASADYTATNGSDVVLASGAATGDILEVVAYTTFTVGSSFTPSIDDNGNATAITIDNNENVLVGKTATNYQTNGVEAKPDGSLWATATNNGPLVATRKSSDGNIASFYKDSNFVGSIYNGGGNLGVNSSGGLLLVDDIITPTSGADATHDIGRSSARYKDAYLSGGIYLGGTGSANKLDDYEYGSWTPTTSNAGSVTPNNAIYTKIGDQVTVWCLLTDFTDRSTATSCTVRGLPFNATNSGVAVGTCMCQYVSNTVHTIYMAPNSGLQFYKSENNTGFTVLNHSDLQSSSSQIYLMATYTSS